MTVELIVGFSFGSLILLWSFRAVRERVRDGWEAVDPASLDHAVYPILAVLLVLTLASSVWRTRQSACEAVAPKIEAQPPGPVAAPAFGGTVVTTTWDRGKETRSSAGGARVSVADQQATAAADGSFALNLPDSLPRDAVVQVTLPDYLPRFLRRDDPAFAGGVVELERKRRAIVLEAQRTADPQRTLGEAQIVRSRLENAIRSADFDLLADEDLRTDILRRLREYQQGADTIYDPATLQRVGDFHGVSHGIFWSVTAQGSNVQLDLKVVNFGTTSIEASLVERIDRRSWPDAAGALGAALAAQMTTGSILSPKPRQVVPWPAAAAGYVHYLPRDWSLWLTLVPNGNARHYPQEELTVEGNLWRASSVYLGERKPVISNQRFQIYLLLVDPGYREEIDRYLQRGAGRGLPLSSWDTRRYHFLQSVEVVRGSS